MRSRRYINGRRSNWNRLTEILPGSSSWATSRDTFFVGITGRSVASGACCAYPVRSATERGQCGSERNSSLSIASASFHVNFMRATSMLPRWLQLTNETEKKETQWKKRASWKGWKETKAYRRGELEARRNVNTISTESVSEQLSKC